MATCGLTVQDKPHSRWVWRPFVRRVGEMCSGRRHNCWAGAAFRCDAAQDPIGMPVLTYWHSSTVRTGDTDGADTCRRQNKVPLTTSNFLDQHQQKKTSQPPRRKLISQGITALGYAVWAGHLATTKVLIEYGAWNRVEWRSWVGKGGNW